MIKALKNGVIFIILDDDCSIRYISPVFSNFMWENLNIFLSKADKNYFWLDENYYYVQEYQFPPLPNLKKIDLSRTGNSGKWLFVVRANGQVICFLDNGQIFFCSGNCEIGHWMVWKKSFKKNLSLLAFLYSSFFFAFLIFSSSKLTFGFKPNIWNLQCSFVKD